MVVTWHNAAKVRPEQSGWYPCGVQELVDEQYMGILRWYDAEKDSWSVAVVSKADSKLAGSRAKMRTAIRPVSLYWSKPWW